MKITEAAGVGQGTFYLYFASKKADLRRGRARPERARAPRDERGRGAGATRREKELLGFGAFFRFTAEHPALYRIIRQAEFVSPETLQLHYERLTERLRRPASSRRWTRARSSEGDPEVLAWA